MREDMAKPPHEKIIRNSYCNIYIYMYISNKKALIKNLPSTLDNPKFFIYNISFNLHSLPLRDSLSCSIDELVEPWSY